MANEFPNSYKDDTYASLDAKTEQKLGLPSGLLASVRTNGERSNHDQSNADTKTATVYQFIPATRKAILDKYGIDVALNPQNASEGAGLLLKEGLDRNKGDAAAAVGEYAGGLDRSKWGPITKNYIARVTGGIPAAAPTAAPAPRQSTFDRVSAQMNGPDNPSMAGVLQAYQSGKMSPEDAKTFEGEVNAGRVMLPRGVALNGAAPAGAPAMPNALAVAYQSGTMEPADRAKLDDLIKQGVIAAPKGASQIPGQTEGAPSDVSKAVPDPTIPERIVGAGEAALNLGTGLVGGPVGAVKGFVGGLADPAVGNLQQLSDATAKGAESLTYQPRTASGQSQAGVVGNVMANAIPLAGMTGELASLSRAGQIAKPTAQITAAAIPSVARDAVGTAAQSVAQGVRAVVPDVIANIPAKVGEMMGREPARPTPGATGSVGAAKTFADTRLGFVNEKERLVDTTSDFHRSDTQNGQLHKALSAASSATSEDVLSALQWAKENGRPDLAMHLADRLEKLAAESRAQKPGVSEGSPKYQAILDSLSKQADAAEAAALQGRAIVGGNSPTPGTMGSAGAAGVDMATQRRMAAQELPVPLDITEGMATRDFGQQRFEKETAKHPELGAPLRERVQTLNSGILRNFDAMVDLTGAEAPDLRATGTVVTQALRDQLAKDKTKVRVAYKAAEKAGDMEAPVTLDGFVDHLNQNAPDAAVAPLLDAAKKRAIQLGIATEGPDGALVAQPVTLKTAETARRAISNATGFDPTNVYHSTLLKQAIDTATDGLGGNLYRTARAERARLAENYQNHAAISDLIGTKRGTGDRQVAVEDVFRRTILNGSVDDIRQVRRVLQRSGDQGTQAWKELQGQTLKNIKEQATGSARDSAGNPTVSAHALNKAVTTLDKSGKLDFIFGKKGAETIRTLNDVVNSIRTSPEGAVNTSTTAAVLLAALDMGISGAGGMPLPVASGLRLVVNNIKDRRIRARVNAALGLQAGNRTIH